MANLRDAILNFRAIVDTKSTEYQPFRAVITDAFGNRTGTNTVWKSEPERLVWIQKLGSGNIGWAFCDVLEPDIGLGVLVQYSPYINRFMVLRDDPVQRSASSNRLSYLAPTYQDFQRGGRFQLFIEPEMFFPLAIYPGSSGLTISIVPGYYETAAGTRGLFAGVVDYDISSEQPAGPNEHNLVGFYLDTSNAIQTVTGSTVATSVTAPEPSWPTDAVRLGVVDLDDTQTTISLADDIDNRRLFVAYPGSGAILKTFLDAKGDLITATADDTPAILSVGADGTFLTADSAQSTGIKWATITQWPFDTINVDPNGDADQTTIQAGHDAASAGDTVIVGPGAYSEDVTLSTAIQLLFLPGAQLTGTLTVQTAASTVIDLDIVNTTASGTLNIVQNSIDGTIFIRPKIRSSGAATEKRGLNTANDATIIQPDIVVSGSTTNYGITGGTGAVITVRGGYIDGPNGDIRDLSGGITANLEGQPTLENGLINGSSVTRTGQFVDGNGDLDEAGDVVVSGSADVGRLIVQTNNAASTSDISLSANAIIETDSSLRLICDSEDSASSREIIFAHDSDDISGNYEELARITEAAEFGLGVNVSTPQGALHIHDGTSGRLFVTKTGVDGTAQTIIPNGAGDVVNLIRFTNIIFQSTEPATVYTSFNLVPGGSQGTVVGSDTVTIFCNANGSVTIQRAGGGSHSHDVTIDAIWQ